MAILQGARITGSIIATSFIKATGFSGSLTASNLYVLGKAGIGTSSPSAKLDIRQTSAATGLKVFTNDTSTAYIAQFIGYDNSLGETTRVVVQADGSVGIGTTSPSNTKLHILGDWVSGHSTAKIQTITSFASGGTSGIGLYDSDGTRSGYLYSYSTGTSVGSSNATPLIFETNGTERMRITSDGKVGIGTSSPNNRLDVVGGTGTTFNMSNDSDSLRGGKLTFISSSATGRQFYVGTTSAIYNLVFGIDSVERARIDTAGNLGIGTTSPAYKLHVEGTGTQRVNIVTTDNSSTGAGVYLQVKSAGSLVSNSTLTIDNAGNLKIFTGTSTDSEKVRVQSDGNVGIGITVPAAKLHCYNGSSGGQVSSNSNVIAIESNGNNGLQFLNPSANNANINFGDQSDNEIGFIQYQHATDAMRFRAGGTTIMSLVSGNVGIGTSSPGAKLNVSGSNTSTLLKLQSPSESNVMFVSGSAFVGIGTSNLIGVLTVYKAGAADRTIHFENGTTANGIDYNVAKTLKLNLITGGKNYSFDSGWRLNAGCGSGIATNNGYLSIEKLTAQDGSLSTEVARFDTNGNFGIGTTSPATKLEVYGVVRVSESSSGGILQLTAGASAIDIASTFYGGSRRPITFTMDSEKIRIDTSGNLLIGTTVSPSHDGISLGSTGVVRQLLGGMVNTSWRIRERDVIDAVAITTNINDAGTQDSSARSSWKLRMGWGNGQDNLVIARSPAGSNSFSDLFFVKSDGNVGIGTTSPVNKLHVSGSSTNLPLKLEGLTSNATGYFLTVDNTTGVVHKSTSGASGTSGTSGANGSPGTSGSSGTSGANGSPGTSGSSGSGSSGISGSSGTSGTTNIKAWVHFDGTGTPTINASLNVSSITDNNTGDYTINFTTAFANANYVVAGTATYEYENPGQSINNMFIAVPRRPTAQLAGSCRISTPGSDNALYDCKYVRVLFSN